MTENIDKSANWNSRDKNILEGNKERLDFKKQKYYKTQQYKLNKHKGEKTERKNEQSITELWGRSKTLIYT